MGRNAFLIATLSAAVGVLVACASPTATPTPSPTPSPTPDPLAGGIVATFDVTGERFKVWLTNPGTIDDVMALQRGESAAHIPNGPILRGNGQAGHNAPHGWHLDPDATEMAEFTIEVCDGAPSYVDEHVDEFVDNVGHYCPWGAELVDVEDHR